VQVFDDQYDRPCFGHVRHQRQHFFQQPGARVPNGRWTEVGQPVAEHRARRRQQRRHRVPAEPPHQRPQDRDERDIGRALGSEFEAAARQHERVAGQRPDRAGHQPRLADPRLARDEHGDRPPVRRAGVRVPQRGGLGLPAGIRTVGELGA
jgi:hypothetical protein